MTKEIRTHGESERGIALITALLAVTVLLALGIAVVFSATTEMVTTKTQRVGEQAFFAADGGIGVARRALAQAFAETMAQISAGTIPLYRSNPPVAVGSFPDVQVLPPPANTTFYQTVLARAAQLANATARAQRMEELSGSKFTVQYSPLSGNVSLLVADAHHATESATFRYSIQVTGQTNAGGSATVHETGRLSLDDSGRCRRAYRPRFRLLRIWRVLRQRRHAGECSPGFWNLFRARPHEQPLRFPVQSQRHVPECRVAG